MSRIKPMLKPSDYPAGADDATRAAAKALFDHMFPGVENPEIPGKSAAFGTVANDPKLALLLVKLSDYVVREMPFTSTRRDLQQLMVQALNWKLGCDFSFQSHIAPAAAAGISLELQTQIPFWKTSNAFNDEQRLVIEYTVAVVEGSVPDELYQRVAAHFDERDTLALTVGVAWWSFWAMIINATKTEFDFGFRKDA
ncbi:carboxymuconolactone decarboxylase family protein [Luteimonas sp. SDU101]|uniref:carboxymuconolactone decarboxylase family protein n=1 Tax=unclassified Luteimonas TaxID=2629088 RepID=UPI003EBF356F